MRSRHGEVVKTTAWYYHMARCESLISANFLGIILLKSLFLRCSKTNTTCCMLNTTWFASVRIGRYSPNHPNLRNSILHYFPSNHVVFVYSQSLSPRGVYSSKITKLSPALPCADHILPQILP